MVPRNKGYATVFSHLKSLFFVSVLIGIELYAHYYSHYEPPLLFFLGFWFVFIGMNLGHEGHHGSASQKPWVNQLYSIGWNLGGESTLHWIHSHLGTIYICSYTYTKLFNLSCTKYMLYKQFGFSGNINICSTKSGL